MHVGPESRLWSDPYRRLQTVDVDVSPGMDLVFTMAPTAEHCARVVLSGVWTERMGRRKADVTDERVAV